MRKHMQHSVGGQKETRPAAPTFAWLYHVPITFHACTTYSVHSAENNYVCTMYIQIMISFLLFG